jgi:hypothetical protein
LEFESKERYFECGAQQTSESLQEYGTNFLEAIEGVGGPQYGN